MTTTPIKDVSKIAGEIPGIGAAKAKTVKNGSDEFDKLFQKQMDDKPKSVQTKKVSKAPVGAMHNNDKVKKADTEDIEEKENTTQTDQSTLELVGSFLTQLSEQMDVDIDVLKEKLEEFGIGETDLLQNDVLGQFFMEMNQVSDSTELLTDEELYSQYQNVFELQQDMVSKMTEMSGKDAVNLETLMSAQTQTKMQEEMTAQETEEEVGPVIEIIRNTPADDGEETDVLIRQEMQKETGHNDNRRSAADSDREFAFTNQMDQQMRFEQMNGQVGMETAPAASQVDTQDIMRQIMDYMKITLDADMDSLEMQLHPASLGTLQIHVSSKGGVMTANFITQNEAVKQALESQMMTLQDSLNEQGIKVAAVEVSVSTNAFDSNLDQERDAQSGSRGHRGRGRRFRTVPDIEHDLKEMKPQEQLAAKIRSANHTN